MAAECGKRSDCQIKDNGKAAKRIYCDFYKKGISDITFLREVNRNRCSTQTPATNPSSTRFCPALSKSIVSLFPSIPAMLPLPNLM